MDFEYIIHTFNRVTKILLQVCIWCQPLLQYFGNFSYILLLTTLKILLKLRYKGTKSILTLRDKDGTISNFFSTQNGEILGLWGAQLSSQMIPNMGKMTWQRLFGVKKIGFLWIFVILIIFILDVVYPEKIREG